MNARTANGTGLSAARLHEVKDCIVLALDATENSSGYSRAQREARSYMRTALRHVVKLQEGQA